MRLRTETIPIRIALTFCVAMTGLASQCLAVDLYVNDFNALTTGPISRPNDGIPYEFHGDANVVFSEEITAAGGIGGTKSYQQSIAATGASYFYAGFGHFAVDSADMPTGPDANNPAMYRFSADFKAVGNSGNPPVQFGIAAIDGDYEAQHNIDVNADGDFLDGASVYEMLFNPVVNVLGAYSSFAFTLNQGTPAAIDADVRPQDRVFSSDLSLLWHASYNSGTFGVDAGNSVNIDNIRIEFLGQPGALLGDYNGNEVVDAADYTVWRDLLNGNSIPNEAVTPNVVDLEDYNYWKSHFGATLGGAGGLSAVPEPASGMLSLVAMIAMNSALGFRARR